MTEQDFDPERAADGLAQAWRDCAQLSKLRSLVRPGSLAEGYDVQDRLIALLGHPVVGWKIGLAGRNGYRAASLQRPIFGRVLAPRCFGNDEPVAVPRGIPITIEVELALVMARDVDANTAVTPDLIRSAHLGFEIVSSRLPERHTIGVAATIADNAVSHAVVLGDGVDFARFSEIAAEAVLTVDGRPAAYSLKGDDLPDPLSVLGHLVAHLAERNTALRGGDVVFTGTLTKPFEVVAPCQLIGGSPAPSVRCALVPGP